jgi:hypothetical protein
MSSPVFTCVVNCESTEHGPGMDVYLRPSGHMFETSKDCIQVSLF